LRLLFVVVLLVVIILSIVALGRLSKSSPTTAASDPTSTGAASSIQPSPAPELLTPADLSEAKPNAEPAKEITPAATPAPEPTATQSAAIQPTSATTPPPPAPSEPTPATPAGESATGAPTATATNPPPETAAAPEVPATFPELTLDRIYYRLRAPTAVLNGQTLAPGDSFKGVKIVKIERFSVLLDWNGSNRVLELPRP
jgi:cytoskeletal protein RodZ